MTLGVPAAIFQEAYLSFIGLGIKPPIPSWGQLANLERRSSGFIQHSVDTDNYDFFNNAFFNLFETA
jgi:ABC-type dipeptide/oligopeptide/nickel transport system permease subunit